MFNVLSRFRFFDRLSGPKFHPLSPMRLCSTPEPERALLEEELNGCCADQQHWDPLRKELEHLRQQRTP